MDILEAQFRKIGADSERLSDPPKVTQQKKWQSWDLPDVNHTELQGLHPYVVVSGTVLTAENKTQRSGGLSYTSL